MPYWRDLDSGRPPVITCIVSTRQSGQQENRCFSLLNQANVFHAAAALGFLALAAGSPVHVTNNIKTLISRKRHVPIRCQLRRHAAVAHKFVSIK